MTQVKRSPLALFLNFLIDGLLTSIIWELATCVYDPEDVVAFFNTSCDFLQRSAMQTQVKKNKPVPAAIA